MTLDQEELLRLRAGFTHPRDVVASPELDTAQKRQVLEHWAADEKALMTAGGEGMEGGQTPRLDEVLRALDQLPPG